MPMIPIHRLTPLLLAITCMSGGQPATAAAPAVPGILTAVVKTAEPLQPVRWADPIQFAQGQLAAALFKGDLTDALKDASPTLLYPAIGVASRNPDGMARATLRGYFEHQLTEKDVQALGPDLMTAIQQMAPADTMFGQEIRMGGVAVLAKYHYQEGIRALAWLLNHINGHGSEARIPTLLEQLKTYGKAARVVVPELRAFIALIQNGDIPDHPINRGKIAQTEAAIKAIEDATDQPVMPTLAPARSR